MFTLIRNADIYAPQPLGVQDIFISPTVSSPRSVKSWTFVLRGVEIAEYDLKGARSSRA